MPLSPTRKDEVVRFAGLLHEAHLFSCTCLHRGNIALSLSRAPWLPISLFQKVKPFHKTRPSTAVCKKNANRCELPGAPGLPLRSFIRVLSLL